MVYTINLAWLGFNVNLDAVNTWIRANVGGSYCGLSANSQLQVHFTEQPDDAATSAIEAYWSGLTAESEEATTYKTAAQIKSDSDAARAAALASATTKLEALGLSSTEIAAILG